MVLQPISSQRQLSGSLDYFRMLESFMDTTPAYISWVGPDLRYRFVNAQYEELFKLPTHEIIGKQLREVLGEETYLQNFPLCQRVLAGEKISFERLLNLGHREVHLSINYVPYAIDGVTDGFVVMCHDISHRKKAELSQRAMADLTSALTDINETTALIDHTKKTLLSYLKANEARILTPDNHDTDIAELGPGLRAELEAESRLFIPDITIHPLANTDLRKFVCLGIRSFLIAPLLKSGKLVGAIWVGSEKIMNWDESDLRVLRTAVKVLFSRIEGLRLLIDLKEAIKAREEFISVCSHELRTPLTSMMLQFQVASKLIDRNDSSVYSVEVVNKRVSVMNRQLGRMGRLIDDMLDVSRIAAGKLSCEFIPMEMKDCVEETLERFYQQLNLMEIQLIKSIDAKALVMADRNRLHQVISNLMSNAIKYGKGKPLRVSLESFEKSVILMVVDQGDGILPEHQERIFNRFERASHPHNVSGLGLGLHISSEIVKHHDGRIWVESIPGEGSAFKVELPLLDLDIN